MRTKCPARSISDFRYSPLAAALALAFGPGEAAAGNNFLVNVQGDRAFAAPTTPGTLRDAIEFFNISDATHCTGAGDTITFFSNGPFTVNVSEALPIIACPGLTINGDLGAFGKAHLQSSGGFIDGLEGFPSPAFTVKNIQVTDFSYGTALRGNLNASSNDLLRNQVGVDTLDFSGPDALNPLLVQNNTVTSNQYGIRSGQCCGSFNQNVLVSGNTVTANQTGIYIAYGGSTVVVDGNTVTGNVDPSFFSARGVFLDWSQASLNNNFISGNDYGVYIRDDQGSKITTNRIGATNDGASAFGNRVGVFFNNNIFNGGSHGTQISGNVISSNAGNAIDVSHFSNVQITGNKIGTGLDAAGQLANGAGIIAYCGDGIEVSGNVISGNSGTAIEFGAVQGGGKLNIVDNKIGVQGDGVTSLGNNAYGVSLYIGNCNPPLIQGPKNAPGAKAVGFTATTDILIRDNTIAYNIADGVLVSDQSPANTGNKIVANKIYANGAKNLNLGAGGGPRPNDPLDADVGPNNGQNYPDITSLVRDWPNTRTLVNFTLDTAPGIYRIDIYSNNYESRPGSTIHHGFQRFDAGSGPTSGTVTIGGLSTGNEPNTISLTATGPFASDADFDQDSVRRDTSEYSPPAFLTPMVAVTVTPSPPNLDFGQIPVNTTSPPQTITLLSSGNVPYRINSMGIGSCSGPMNGGGFIISNTCIPGHDYLPGESCQITGRFAPISLGSQSITIADCDNTFLYGGSRTFTMAGVAGAPPPIAIEPPEYDYGEVLAGSSSPPTVFAVRNPGPSTISIGPVTVSGGDFTIDSTTCGSSIASGAICTADVSFRPTQPTRSNATLSVTAGSAPSSVTIAHVTSSSGTATAFLTGLGIQQADIALPSFIDFGTYTVGTAPIRQSVQITNTGNAVVSFSNISVTGAGFVLTNGCPLNIQPGESCTLTIDFSVPNVDSFTGTLAVVSNAVGGTRSIALTARSVALPLAQLSVSPNNISFGDRLLGTTSATQRVTIRNVGNIPVTVASITTSPDYVVSGNTCSLPLAPTSTCFADVALRPAGFGPRPGQLFVTSNGVGSPNVVGLGGTGCRPFSNSASRFGMGSGFNCAR